MYCNNTNFIARLITKGRKTGKMHIVLLRAVQYNNKIYFSRHNINSDWLKNTLIHPNVIVKYNNKSYYGKASMIKDEILIQTISSIKYHGSRSTDRRVVIEITLS